MPVEGGLLVDHGGGERHPANGTEFADRGPDLGQALHRHAEQATKVVVPSTGGEIHQRGTRGRCHVGDALAGELLQEPGVGRA